VTDALPFMKRAAHTYLFHVDEGEGGVQSLKEVQAALARHQIEAKIETQPRGERPIEDEVVQFARRNKGDLIVAGAYGHTRFREWVFGGMTRGFLGNCPMACLMSH
jgi:nucleotide-binding universal stress UspA family protein